MTYIYEDPKTGELYHYSRKGIYKKSGRTLIFVKRTRGDKMKNKETEYKSLIEEADFILNRYKSESDDAAGYPPNCNEGYVEKDGKCVPVDKQK
jgi:hypothetical protein